jgi:hypothetical protein
LDFINTVFHCYQNHKISLGHDGDTNFMVINWGMCLFLSEYSIENDTMVADVKGMKLVISSSDETIVSHYFVSTNLLLLLLKNNHIALVHLGEFSEEILARFPITESQAKLFTDAEVSQIASKLHMM